MSRMEVFDSILDGFLDPRRLRVRARRLPEDTAIRCEELADLDQSLLLVILGGIRVLETHDPLPVHRWRMLGRHRTRDVAADFGLPAECAGLVGAQLVSLDEPREYLLRFSWKRVSIRLSRRCCAVVEETLQGCQVQNRFSFWIPISQTPPKSSSQRVRS